VALSGAPKERTPERARRRRRRRPWSRVSREDDDGDGDDAWSRVDGGGDDRKPLAKSQQRMTQARKPKTGNEMMAADFVGPWTIFAQL